MSRFNMVVAALEELEIRFQVHRAPDGKQLLTATIGAMRTRFHLMAYLDQSENVFVVLALSACRVPNGALGEVMRLANRINPELTLGALCINDDSDLVFKASSLIADVNVQQVVQHLIAGAAVVFDRFEPAFNSVIYANTPADDAFKHACC